MNKFISSLTAFIDFVSFVSLKIKTSLFQEIDFSNYTQEATIFQSYSQGGHGSEKVEDHCTTHNILPLSQKMLVSNSTGIQLCAQQNNGKLMQDNVHRVIDFKVRF